MMKKLKEKKAKTGKRREIYLRFRKNDPTHNLIAATQHWIKANGGTAIVLGGIGLLADGAFKYSVCLRVVGRAPTKKEAS